MICALCIDIVLNKIVKIFIALIILKNFNGRRVYCLINKTDNVHFDTEAPSCNRS
jgi:hypothetical protein